MDINSLSSLSCLLSVDIVSSSNMFSKPPVQSLGSRALCAEALPPFSLQRVHPPPTLLSASPPPPQSTPGKINQSYEVELYTSDCEVKLITILLIKLPKLSSFLATPTTTTSPFPPCLDLPFVLLYVSFSSLFFFFLVFVEREREGLLFFAGLLSALFHSFVCFF